MQWFIDERMRPLSVFAPVLLVEFARLAAIFRSLVGRRVFAVVVVSDMGVSPVVSWVVRVQAISPTHGLL